MKVLITGTTGFVGNHLQSRLQKKNLTRAFVGDITKHSDWNKNLKFNPDIIVLVAGIRTETDKDFTVNTKSVENLSIELFKSNNKPKTIIYISTQAVYFGLKAPFNERMAVNPETKYAKSKLLAEKKVLQFGKKEKIRTVLLRTSTILGSRVREGNKMSGPLFVWTKNAFLNKPIEIFQDGDQTRDYIHVDDLVSAILLAVENESLQGIFNVGGGKHIKLVDLANWIKTSAKSKSEILIMGGKPTASDPREMFSDTTKLRKFGWKPKKTPKEAVEEFVKSIKIY